MAAIVMTRFFFFSSFVATPYLWYVLLLLPYLTHQKNLPPPAPKCTHYTVVGAGLLALNLGELDVRLAQYDGHFMLYLWSLNLTTVPAVSAEQFRTQVKEGLCSWDTIRTSMDRQTSPWPAATIDPWQPLDIASRCNEWSEGYNNYFCSFVLDNVGRWPEWHVQTAPAGGVPAQTQGKHNWTQVLIKGSFYQQQDLRKYPLQPNDYLFDIAGRPYEDCLYWCPVEEFTQVFSLVYLPGYTANVIFSEMKTSTLHTCSEPFLWTPEEKEAFESLPCREPSASHDALTCLADQCAVSRNAVVWRERDWGVAGRDFDRLTCLCMAGQFMTSGMHFYVTRDEVKIQFTTIVFPVLIITIASLSSAYVEASAIGMRFAAIGSSLFALVAYDKSTRVSTLPLTLDYLTDFDYIMLNAYVFVGLQLGVTLLLAFVQAHWERPKLAYAVAKYFRSIVLPVSLVYLVFMGLLFPYQWVLFASTLSFMAVSLFEHFFHDIFWRIADQLHMATVDRALNKLKFDRPMAEWGPQTVKAWVLATWPRNRRATRWAEVFFLNHVDGLTLSALSEEDLGSLKIWRSSAMDIIGKRDKWLRDERMVLLLSLKDSPVDKPLYQWDARTVRAWLSSEFPVELEGVRQGVWYSGLCRDNSCDGEWLARLTQTDLVLKRAMSLSDAGRINTRVAVLRATLKDTLSLDLLDGTEVEQLSRDISIGTNEQGGAGGSEVPESVRSRALLAADNLNLLRLITKQVSSVLAPTERSGAVLVSEDPAPAASPTLPPPQQLKAPMLHAGVPPEQSLRSLLTRQANKTNLTPVSEVINSRLGSEREELSPIQENAAPGMVEPSLSSSSGSFRRLRKSWDSIVAENVAESSAAKKSEADEMVSDATDRASKEDINEDTASGQIVNDDTPNDAAANDTAANDTAANYEALSEVANDTANDPADDSSNGAASNTAYETANDAANDASADVVEDVD